MRTQQSAVSNQPKRRKRTNIQKQEELVSALWEFAADLQLRPNQGCVATIATGQEDAGTKCSLEHVGSAKKKIMAIFGYDCLIELS
jgi:hypothetical protein